MTSPFLKISRFPCYYVWMLCQSKLLVWWDIKHRTGEESCTPSKVHPTVLTFHIFRITHTLIMRPEEIRLRKASSDVQIFLILVGCGRR